ncbi:MFS transporter TsgA [Buchnera aphidicola]|uniref:MFS transporter TsgA n=1 Tax=Buchnera aphidicola (Stegophylla sp.) TaxID=2315800 RepID=A0A4D6YEP1_9GAMM|nr:MFS transporter TsgA [Buchnera aphidicola (Stegophylla sp.)]QCI26493.1 MFS transporter TsgA [Buchnera aphidicola (Stegophylla sp.)]
MKKNNKIKLTIISFLSYYFTGSTITITGIMIRSIAEYFHTSIINISNIFTFFNSGMLCAILFNSWITNFITFKKQIIIGFILIILSITNLIYVNNLTIFSINIFTLGIISGTIISIGTFLITSIYTSKTRTSKLLITDSFFSMSGILFPIVASNLLSKHIPWYSIYIIIGIIYFIIFCLTINTKFPTIQDKLKNNNHNNIQWNINIPILCCLALFYILGQLGFISWIPEYATQTIGVNIQRAGKLVSYFWMSYMLGMWFFSYILKSFDLQKSLLYLTGLSTICMYTFIINQKIKILNIIISILGFVSSAIYTIIITLTSLQTKKTSQKLINLILISGTTGTLLTFLITSPIVHKIGIIGALITSNILYLITFILSWILGFVSQHKKNI